MSRRMTRFIKKRAARRRLVLYSFVIVFVLMIGLLAVDLTSSQLLTGRPSLGVLALYEDTNGTYLTLFGEEFRLPINEMGQALQSIRTKLVGGK